ncbi:hypothetical protein Tco_0830696 [Tanacetum coccineum]
MGRKGYITSIVSIMALDNVVEEVDGEWICFLGGNSFSGTKKYRGSNSSDGGNTEDRVKIAGGVIGSGDEIGSKSGRNGSFSLRTPRKHFETSFFLLLGFYYELKDFSCTSIAAICSGASIFRLCFLNFFNDPKIIREQRIAAYKGYRGGGVVQV